MAIRAPDGAKNMRGLTRFPECQAHKRVKNEKDKLCLNTHPKTNLLKQMIANGRT